MALWTLLACVVMPLNENVIIAADRFVSLATAACAEGGASACRAGCTGVRWPRAAVLLPVPLLVLIAPHPR